MCGGSSMNKDIYNIIASSSKGNCEIAFNSIMVDCGVPFSMIKPYLYDVQLVLLSHIHFDHFNISTIKKMAFERPSLRFGMGKWMVEYMKGIKNIDVYEFGAWYDYGAFKISIGKAYHDVENAFFRIEKNGYKIFRVTDSAHLQNVTAKGYQLYCLEHSYDDETIDEKIESKIAKGEFAYEKGVQNSHLSEQQANDFIFRNKGKKYEILRLHEH